MSLQVFRIYLKSVAFSEFTENQGEMISTFEIQSRLNIHEPEQRYTDQYYVFDTVLSVQLLKTNTRTFDGCNILD